MGKGRLEAFSDGVIAIIITIMVLEFQAPHEATLQALLPLVPVFLSYVLSFIYVGIYWNNHHHMLATAHGVNGAVLWANLHLLFWLSLFPLSTRWIGENPHAVAPTAVYGVILFMAGIAYLLLQIALVREEGPNSAIRKAVGCDWKGKFSAVLYAGAIALSFFHTEAAQIIYAGVALMWLVPDQRLERYLSGRN
ncbi:MAG TPA: TMEM175 family protein [Alphaproteobacteria bacterium]|nr:TMEM175 family protein [Alphaproteobacteria bacterium]